MKKPILIFLNNVLDNNQEHEFFCDKEYGYTVKITYNENSNFPKEQIINNVTEIHYLYKSFKEQIACESDIHTTGITRLLKDIKKIEINYSDKLYTNI